MNVQAIFTDEVLERIHASRYKRLQAAFADVETLDFIGANGERAKAEDAGYFADLGVMSVLYLVNCGDFLQHVEAFKRFGWSIEHSYVYKREAEIGSARIKRNDRTVIIENLEGAYFKGCANVDEAYEAWQALQRIFATNPIGDKLTLLVSALNSGLELLRVCLPQGVQYPRQSDDVIRLLKETDHQNRIEIFDSEAAKLKSIFYYDRQFAYAQCCSTDLPIGEPTLDALTDYDPYAVGWYCVDFTVPANWQHVGLIPVNQREEGKPKWFWPSEAGQSFSDIWVSAPELQIAHVNGWRFTIKQRLLWDSKNKRPLDNWRKHIVRMRDDEAGKLPEPVRSHVRAALRDMLLKPIGKMASVKDEDLLVMSGEQLAEEFETLDREAKASMEMRDDGSVTIRKRKTKSAFREMFTHPEWSSYIWARNRATLAKAMLNIPREQLIACRVDAVYVTEAIPDHYNGKANQFRLKGSYQGKAVKYPESINDLNGINDRLK